MQKIVKTILLTSTLLLAFFGVMKKKNDSKVSDAIRLPELDRKMIVEDFEIAAFHNQA
jgi:hypothetical protein